jgi:hypothetical protein
MQGFSWTTFFWGPFPALFRGHFLAALVLALVSVITLWLGTFVFAFFYNSWHWNWLTAKGFRPLNSHMPQFNIVNNVGSVTHAPSTYQ